MSQPRKPRYRTTWKQYNAALKARGSLKVWLDKRMSWFAAASSKPLHALVDPEGQRARAFNAALKLGQLVV